MTEPAAGHLRRLILLPHRLFGYCYVGEVGRAYQQLGVDVVFGPDNLFESTARFDIVHLQWPEDQYRGYGSGPVESRAKTFLSRLDSHKDRGAKLVWTVHNSIPHEYVGSAVDMDTYQGVIDRADLIVHHCNCSERILASAYRIPTNAKTIVVPHGNFAGYPGTTSRAEARRKLGIPSDAVVYLSFGAIRGYKGLDTLVGAFRRVRIKRKFLLVAGSYTGAGGMAGKWGSLKLVLLNSLNPRARLDLRTIPDENVHAYFSAADAVVLGHSRGLNSGVAVLGMSLGKLVIGPELGCISDVLKQGENIVYPPNDITELVLAMEQVPKLDLTRIGALNRAVANSWDWLEGARAILQRLDASSDAGQPA